MTEKEQELHRYLELVVKQANISHPHIHAANGSELGQQELKAIEFIAQRGSCRMRDIAIHLLLDPSTITWLVDKLMRKEIVRRVRSGQDRRVVTIELTESGAALYQKYLDKSRQNESIYRALNEGEKDILLILLKKIVHQI